jgi:hypothetical protein
VANNIFELAKGLPPWVILGLEWLPASHFKLPIYSVPLRGTELTGERLSQLLSNCRKRH